MSEDFKMQAPIKVEIKVMVTNGETSGEVTYGLSAFQYPTKEDIDHAMKEVEDSSVLKDSGMRLMTKREAFDYMIFEKTGCTDTFALPNGDEWDEVE